MKLFSLLLVGALAGGTGVTYQVVTHSQGGREISREKLHKLEITNSPERNSFKITANGLKDVENWTFMPEADYSLEAKEDELKHKTNYYIGGPSIERIKKLDEVDLECADSAGISRELERVATSRKNKRGCGGTLWKIIRRELEDIKKEDEDSYMLYGEEVEGYRRNAISGGEGDIEDKKGMGPAWVVKTTSFRGEN